uniref:Apolipoprotein L3 n=1 Tax=Leptobrachium leishanense TaxID=445787 RepID=A0A8C5Q0E6_9ANUR
PALKEATPSIPRFLIDVASLAKCRLSLLISLPGTPPDLQTFLFTLYYSWTFITGILLCPLFSPCYSMLDLLVYQTLMYIEEFDSNQKTFISDLEEYIKELHSIADEVDNFHRKAVITNVVGSSVGIAGGVATIAGLILSPFTLGASLAITGIGVAAAAAGGVTSAAASIADNVHIKNQCEKAEVIIKKIIELIDEIKSLLGLNDVDLGRLGGRGLYTAGNVARLIHLSKLSATAAQGVKLAARSTRIAGAVSGVFAVLFIGVDIAYVVKGAQELADGAKTKEAEKIREVVKELDGTLCMMHSKAEEFKNCKIVLDCRIQSAFLQENP